MRGPVKIKDGVSITRSPVGTTCRTVCCEVEG